MTGGKIVRLEGPWPLSAGGADTAINEERATTKRVLYMPLRTSTEPCPAACAPTLA